MSCNLGHYASYMELHFLPGDAQVKEFRESGIGGETLVCRECLVEGDLSGADLNEFFENRAAFINDTFQGDRTAYEERVASQFRRLLELDDRAQVNLWFEYELFCSVNMWLCLDLLANTAAAVYRTDLEARPPRICAGVMNPERSSRARTSGWVRIYGGSIKPAIAIRSVDFQPRLHPPFHTCKKSAKPRSTKIRSMPK